MQRIGRARDRADRGGQERGRERVGGGGCVYRLSVLTITTALYGFIWLYTALYGFIRLEYLLSVLTITMALYGFIRLYTASYG